MILTVGFFNNVICVPKVMNLFIIWLYNRSSSCWEISNRWLILTSISTRWPEQFLTWTRFSWAYSNMHRGESAPKEASLLMLKNWKFSTKFLIIAWSYVIIWLTLVYLLSLTRTWPWLAQPGCNFTVFKRMSIMHSMILLNMIMY